MSSFEPLFWRGASALALALFSAGCGELLDYPEVGAENSIAACGDGVDNDLDGAIDCADPDCSFCSEDTQSACYDSRDNDGDGLTDAGDPGCWPFLAPEVQRCAGGSGFSLVERFDSGLQAYSPVSPWIIAGQYPLESGGFRDIVSAIGWGGGLEGDAQDNFVLFESDPNEPPSSDANLGVLLRRSAFSGSLRDFSLSFLGGVADGALLRAAIVPVDLAPLSEPPRAGAESALSVSVDATQAPARLTLTTEGISSSTPLPGCDSSGCPLHGFELRVGIDDQGFLAELRWEHGQAEVRRPPPRSLSLAPARLTFWGRGAARGTWLDTVRLDLAPERPCGGPAPQIPGNACELGDQRAFGQVVSLGGDDGGFCAIVGSSSLPDRSEPEELSAWSSSDGLHWSKASSLQGLMAGAEPIGAGIARDDASWQIAVLYRESGEVRLGFASGDHCGPFGPLTPGPTLFSDAEAPSYVIAGGEHAVYFTRPPTGSAARSLWRLTRDPHSDRVGAPERVAELPSVVSSPVSVQRVGRNDLVLLHPTALSAGAASLGLMVGDVTGRSWRLVEPSSLLPLPDRTDIAVFDDRGTVSGALAWNGSEGFLLYGALSAPSPKGFGGFTSGGRAVGTARLVSAGQEFTEEAQAFDACGDGSCGPGESCGSCPADCRCNGKVLSDDVFSQAADWNVVSNNQFPTAYQYLDGPELNWAGGADTWSTLPLGTSVIGDFELSFDAMVDAVDPTGPSCSFYVGLTSDSTHSDAVATEGDGFFARLAYSRYCPRSYRATPVVKASGAVFSEPEERAASAYAACDAGDGYLPVGPRRRFTLRREGNRVSVITPLAGGCGFESRTVEYDGAVSTPTQLRAGFGADVFGGCGLGAGSGRLQNLELRLLSDANACPSGTEACSGACIDPMRSAEHCGGCDNACAANQVCIDGACVCNAERGILDCGGNCVDPRSLEHCGGCEQPCDGACVRGVCESGKIGSCYWPIVLPLDDRVPLSTEAVAVPDLAYPVDFSGSTADASTSCGVVVHHRTVLNWTAVADGVATFELDTTGTLLDTVLDVTSDERCERSLSCNDDGLTLGKGSRVDLPVLQGTTYHLSIGLRDGDPLSGVANLRIKLVPISGGSIDTFSSPPPTAAAPEDVEWLAFDGSTAKSELGRNAELGIDGAFVTYYSDSCSNVTWDPETRCLRGTLCDPGPDWSNWGASVRFLFRSSLDAATGLVTSRTWNPADFGARGLAWETSGTPWIYGVFVGNMDPVWNGACPGDQCSIGGPGDGTTLGPGNNPDEPTTPAIGQLLFNGMIKESWATAAASYVFDPRAVDSLTFKLYGKSGPIEFCVDRLGIVR